MEILLISEKLFRENSPIQDNTNLVKFIPYIGIAQKIYIEPLLGKALFEELQAQVQAAAEPQGSCDAITPDNRKLLQKIAPVLSFYAVYQGIPFHWAAIVNKGITIRESENSRGVAIDDLAQLRRWLRDDAQVLARTLVDFLTEHRDAFPLWRASDECGCATRINGFKNFGIFIPER